jgi:hypothetical protein
LVRAERVHRQQPVLEVLAVISFHRGINRVNQEAIGSKLKISAKGIKIRPTRTMESKPGLPTQADEQAASEEENQL